MSYQNYSMNQHLDVTHTREKALKFAAAHGAIGFKEAKVKAEEFLKIVNAACKKIAKKYGRRYRQIIFSDL